MNVALSYFCTDDEVDVLVELFNKAYRLGLDNEDGIILTYINLSGDYKITIDDLSYPVNFSSYSEYNDYTLEDLEDQLSLIYHEFYSQGIYYDPVVIMIHDAANMCDDKDEYELLKYLNDKIHY
jgi:hypothetical protein